MCPDCARADSALPQVHTGSLRGEKRQKFIEEVHSLPLRVVQTAASPGGHPLDSRALEFSELADSARQGSRACMRRSVQMSSAREWGASMLIVGSINVDGRVVDR